MHSTSAYSPNWLTRARGPGTMIVECARVAEQLYDFLVDDGPTRAQHAGRFTEGGLHIGTEVLGTPPAEAIMP
jgi:hypothetical protein